MISSTRGIPVFRHILIPTDGSEVASIGVDKGLELARENGCRVTIVTVTEPLGGQFAFAGDLWAPSDDELAAYNASQAKLAEKIFAPLRHKAMELDVPIETVHIPWRLPAAAIVQTADEKGCDLIVISSHGRTGIDRVVLGSQTARVLAAANVPVLVAR
jgi:nucleotide-binding universal stress UspA family protein